TKGLESSVRRGSARDVRDVASIRESVSAHVARWTGRPVRVDSVTVLAGGACQDNVRVELTIGDERSTFVLRSDAARSLPGSLDRATEFRVIEAAVARGVRTPRARWLGNDLVRERAGAYFLDWVDGEAIGRKIVKDSSFATARKNLARELAAELAKIHAI